VLILFARLARGDVAWLDGVVTVEITGNDVRTLVVVFREEGWGIKERLVTQARFRVPFDEFERAVEISAKRFAPLKVTMTPTKIVLTTTSATAPATPPKVDLDEKSLGTSPPPALGIPQEPEPFELPPPSSPDPSDPDPFAPDPFAGAAPAAPVPAEAETEPGFGAFIDTNEIDDPALAAAIVSPRKPPPEPPPTKPAPIAAEPGAGPAKPKGDPVHNRPTVRRMVAIKPEALRTGRKDPRREEDD
jgi:hypothetical protein